MMYFFLSVRPSRAFKKVGVQISKFPPVMLEDLRNAWEKGLNNLSNHLSEFPPHDTRRGAKNWTRYGLEVRGVGNGF